jgi:hypothetical protein
MHGTQEPAGKKHVWNTGTWNRDGLYTILEHIVKKGGILFK